MKTASVKEIKNELHTKSGPELIELCLNLSKFKKDNKEFLTYLLFESSNEEAYRRAIKEDIDELFSQINESATYYIKKGVQKALRFVKKQIRYSKNKETEAVLLIYFCEHMMDYSRAMASNAVLRKIYHRQLDMIQKAVSTLHEDLQYDYEDAIQRLHEYL